MTKLTLINGKKENVEKSVENLLIQGDGLDALEALNVKGKKVDIIMIDPPYNEGKSAGKYQDRWKGSGDNFKWAGESHGAFLDFLHPRIELSKQLLTEEGCIMLFIGDREYHYVRTMMEQVYGEKNYIGTVIWDSSSNQQKTKKINRKHEYVILFCKDAGKFPGLYKFEKESFSSQLHTKALSLKGIEFKKAEIEYLEFYNEIRKKDLSNVYKYLLPNEYIPFNCGPSGDPREGNKTILKHPITKKNCPLPRDGKGWRFSQEYLDRISTSKNIHKLHDGKVLVLEQHSKVDAIKGMVFGKDETLVPHTCKAFSVNTDKRVFTTTGHNFTGDKKEGLNLETGFETIKPKEFLTELILNYPKKEAIILDFFAGSGTTAVAVEEANKIDAGKRNWLLVEINPETIKEVIFPKLKYFGITKFKFETLKINKAA